MVVTLLISVLALIGIAFVILFVNSPGTVTPTWNEPTGIAEKVFMDIGGTSQGMIIKSVDEKNPVLLVLHGGPGSTEYAVLVPIYIFAGKYDYQTTYNQALLYYEALEAPQKAFYTFENSAHSPMLEEPALFLSILENEIIRQEE